MSLIERVEVILVLSPQLMIVDLIPEAKKCKIVSTFNSHVWSYALCTQNPRYIEITGVLVSAVACFFIGPPKFFGEPYVAK